MANLKEHMMVDCLKSCFKIIVRIDALASSRLTVVSCEAKKKQYARESSGLCDHYSELFTRMAALKFVNAVTQPL